MAKAVLNAGFLPQLANDSVAQTMGFRYCRTQAGRQTAALNIAAMVLDCWLGLLGLRGFAFTGLVCPTVFCLSQRRLVDLARLPFCGWRWPGNRYGQQHVELLLASLAWCVPTAGVLVARDRGG